MAAGSGEGVPRNEVGPCQTHLILGPAGPDPGKFTSKVATAGPWHRQRWEVGHLIPTPKPTDPPPQG